MRPLRSTLLLLALAVPPAHAGAPCACPHPSFGPAPRAYSAGTTPVEIGTVVDIDADGRLDLVLAARSVTGVVTTLHGDGEGGFGAPVVSSIGHGGYQAILTADFDGDGRLDVALAGGNVVPEVAVALGDGSGSFTFAWNAFSGGNPSSIVSADFDEDGRADLVVTATASAQIAFFRGLGDGTFATPSFEAVPSGPTDLLTADWNQDQHADLAYLEPASSAIRIRLGDGLGGFGPPVSIAAGPGPRDLKAADLDGDGPLDFVVSRPAAGMVSVLRGLGGTTFAPRADYPAADQPGPSDEPGRYALGDLDSDGRLDLVASHTYLLDGHLSVLRGSTGASFLPAVRTTPGLVGDVQLADFDGDGRLDASVIGGLWAKVAHGRGDGGLDEPVRFVTSDEPRALAAGRMNGDAPLDLVVALPDAVVVRIADGSGGLGATFTAAVPAVRTLSLGDLDGDLDLDVVAGVDSDIVVLTNSGDGSLNEGSTHSAGIAVTATVLGDLNEDGDLDAVALDSAGVALFLFRGQAGATFTADGEVPLAGNAPATLALADLNYDHHLDVVVGYAGSSDVDVFLGDGTGALGSPARYPTLGDQPGMGIADLDEDGTLDVATGGSVLRGDGAGALQAPLPLPMGGGGYLPVDVNGDGHLDLVGRTSDGVAVVFVGDGTGTFAPPLTYAAVSVATGIVVTDFNPAQDSRPDIVMASRYTHELVWLRNIACEPRRLRLAVDVGGPAAAGVRFPTQPAVEVQDEGGNVLACATGDVTASLLAGTGTPGAVLSGDAAVAPVQGTASFLDLAVNRAGTGYRLEFAHAAAGRTRSGPFDVGPPRVSVADLQRTEGDGGGSVASVPFTLSGPSDAVVTVPYATRAGSATPGSDYQEGAGAVTFPSGVTQAFASVVVFGDLFPEPNEFLHVDAGTPVNATLGSATGRLRIVDDDGGSFVLGELSHGSQAARTLAPAAAPNHLYLVHQDGRSSYEATVDAASGDLGAGSGPGLRRVASDLTTVLQESTSDGTGPVRRIAWERTDSSTTESEYLQVRSVGCTLDCGPDDGYRVRFRETTAFIPRFNNGGGQTTVLVLQNPGGRLVSGHAWFWSPNGALLTNAAVALPAHGSTVLVTATLPGLAGAAGTVTISHDGGYGALVGKAVALEPAAGFSFDSPMVVRAR
jgi:VCBS repeat protein/Calx-beta domain-containing protein